MAIFSVLWLAERMTIRKVAALLLTLAGVALVASSGGGTIRITPGGSRLGPGRRLQRRALLPVRKALALGASCASFGEMAISAD